MNSASNRSENRSYVMAIFGVCVIASGWWRFRGAEGGATGLWFGLVMGGLALASARLFYVGRSLLAQIIGWISVTTVGGWFIYESFVRKGLSQAEPRQLIVIGITLVTALCILFLTWSRSSESADVDV